jgi:phosphomannomutase
MPIHFGTDGWRAVISDTFTFHNLRLVAQAIADAIPGDTWKNGISPTKPFDSRKVVVD